MSFTSIVKNEISKLESSKLENVAELSAIIRNIAIIDSNIKITTENASTARMIFNKIKDIYGVTPKITVRQGYNFNKNMFYILEIKDKMEDILNDLSIMIDGDFYNIPKEYIAGDEEEIRAYLKGVFLATGSINDPKTSRYHLEFIVNDVAYANYVSELLNKFNLNSKVIRRDNKYMIYIKEAEKNADFLRLINATNSLFYYEDIRIYRDHKNMTNRLNNCEQANIDKIVMTGNAQVNDIMTIQKAASLDALDPKIKQVAIYRLKYPEASLLELSEIISLETGNNISKPGLYHRLNKIKKLAEKIRENQDK